MKILCKNPILTNMTGLSSILTCYDLKESNTYLERFQYLTLCLRNPLMIFHDRRETNMKILCKNPILTNMTGLSSILTCQIWMKSNTYLLMA